jgi:phosphoglycolate phosphatase
MHKTLFLFDIDGTILKSKGAGVRSMQKIGRKLFGEGFNAEATTVAGQLDPVIFAAATAALKLHDHDLQHREFHDHYLIELEAELGRVREHVRVMPGIREILVALHERANQRGDVVLGLLTGNYRKAAALKLAAVGIPIEWFKVTAYGEDGPSRPDLVLVAMRQYEQLTDRKPDPKRVIVIGDTPKDVHCAKVHGCIAVAVATGAFAIEELRKTDADLVLTDLADPKPVIELIG